MTTVGVRISSQTFIPRILPRYPQRICSVRVRVPLCVGLSVCAVFKDTRGHILHGVGESRFTEEDVFVDKQQYRHKLGVSGTHNCKPPLAYPAYHSMTCFKNPFLKILTQEYFCY